MTTGKVDNQPIPRPPEEKPVSGNRSDSFELRGENTAIKSLKPQNPSGSLILPDSSVSSEELKVSKTAKEWLEQLVVGVKHAEPDSSLSKSGLVKANSIQLGAALTPPQYAYDPNSDFNRYMGLAAHHSQTYLREGITAQSIRDSLNAIAEVRRMLDIAQSGKQKTDYGRSIETAHGTWMEDMIDSSGRHALVYKKAESLVSSSAAKCYQIGTIKIDRNTYNLSEVFCSIEVEKTDKFNEVRFNTVYLMRHPNHKTAIKIKNFALQKLAGAFSETPWNLNDIAESYRLLCHGTPYMLGTPSIVETFLDGMFRSKGWALPKKVNEPFWNAIFHHTETEGPYTWEKFMKNYESSSNFDRS